LLIECVKTIDLPFGKLERFDYDGDGNLDDVWEKTDGVDNVRIDTAELLDYTVRITYTCAGVCQGAFPGDGDTSFFFGLASRHDTALRDGSVSFDSTPSNEIVTLRVPNVPVTPAMEDYAFAWAHEASAASDSPSPFYSYDRAGGPITITQTSPGASKSSSAG
jgi:hypothetical protein